MKLEELLKELRRIETRQQTAERDREVDHSDADDLLCEYVRGQGEIGEKCAEVFRNLSKWYS
jgi:hypothetical protein